MKDSLNKVGVRQLLYGMAQQYNGLHVDEEELASFKYVEEDLHVLVAFKEERDAHGFQLALCDLDAGTRVSGLKGAIEMCKKLGDVKGYDAIWGNEYDPTDSNTPTKTPFDLLQDATSEVVTIISMNTPLARLQSIENPKWWARTKPQSLHLIDRAVCDKDENYAPYKTTPNNRISAGSVFHDWFDGRSNDHEQLVLSVGSVGEPEIVVHPDKGSRVRVFLILTFLNEDVKEILVPQLQVGARVVNSELLQYEVSVLVENAKDFCYCVNWKKNKTLRKLQEKNESGKYVGRPFEHLFEPTEEETALSLNLEDIHIDE
jgi:hypothetical protein